jgi:hypothetical protein
MMDLELARDAFGWGRPKARFLYHPSGRLTTLCSSDKGHEIEILRGTSFHRVYHYVVRRLQFI